MRKTTFAGLTVLDPGESLSVDGGSFTQRNPEITDHFLELGAFSHRHDGHAALADPLLAPGVAGGTGGTLPAATAITATYTLVDAFGGETAAAPIAVVTTPDPITAPETPVAAMETTAGTLTSGTYFYVLTLLDNAGGETTASQPVQVIRDPGPANGQVRLTGLTAVLAAHPGAVAYRIYRSKGVIGDYDLLITDDADTVLDDGSVPLDCGVKPPRLNTTNNTASVTVTVPDVGTATGYRVYLSVDSEFLSPALYGITRLAATATDPILVTALLLDDGRPPDVSTAVAGAQKINLATDVEGLSYPPALIAERGGLIPSAAGTVALLSDGATGVGFTAALIYFDPAEHAIAGLQAKLHVSATLVANDTAPAANYAVGLHALGASSGADATTVDMALGALVGAQAIFTAPAANAQAHLTSTPADAPAAGYYCLAVAVSAAPAANAGVFIRATVLITYEVAP